MNLIRLPWIVAAAVIATPVVAQAPALIGTGKAVATAEAALSGHAVSAEIDRRDGRIVYEVELVRGNHLYEATVDARTGRLIGTDRQRLESLWASYFDKARLRAPARSLGATLAAIERETGGRVDEISLDVDGATPIYEVEVTTAAGTAEIAIDATTGERLPSAIAD